MFAAFFDRPVDQPGRPGRRVADREADRRDEFGRGDGAAVAEEGGVAAFKDRGDRVTAVGEAADHGHDFVRDRFAGTRRGAGRGALAVAEVDLERTSADAAVGVDPFFVDPRGFFDVFERGTFGVHVGVGLGDDRFPGRFPARGAARFGRRFGARRGGFGRARGRRAAASATAGGEEQYGQDEGEGCEGYGAQPSGEASAIHKFLFLQIFGRQFPLTDRTVSDYTD